MALNVLVDHFCHNYKKLWDEKVQLCSVVFKFLHGQRHILTHWWTWLKQYRASSVGLAHRIKAMRYYK